MNSIKVKIVILILLTYLILFEFLFPANGLFPSISVILLSISELITDYNFLSNLASTVAAVYITVLVNYLIAKILLSVIGWIKSGKFSLGSEILLPITSIFHYIPFILIALLFLIWFPDFILDKYLIAILILLPQSLSEVFDKNNSDKASYFYFYKSLGLKDHQVMNKIIFRLIEPEILLSQLKNHSLIWSVVIVTEFIQRQEGIGGILFTVFKYQDISLLFTITLLISLLVFIAQKILNLVYNKVYFWK